ncbi:MAG: hypothetical protein V1707_03095 [bacterium]
MDEQNKIEEIKKLSLDMMSLAQKLQALAMDVTGPIRPTAGLELPEKSEQKENTIEGVFDGERMLDADGKSYTVASNYASKSKLVEGDLLKLNIQSDGSFVYKQVGPVERSRLTGVLAKDYDSDHWTAVADGTTYRVLGAAVTYFKGQPGDQAVLLVPQSRSSHWAAIETIIKK